MPWKKRKKKKVLEEEVVEDAEEGGSFVTTLANVAKSKKLHKRIPLILNQNQNQILEEDHEENPLKFVREQLERMAASPDEPVYVNDDFVKCEGTLIKIDEMAESRNSSVKELERNYIIAHKHNVIVQNFQKRGCRDSGRAYDEFMKLIEMGNIETSNVSSDTLTHPFLLYNLVVLHYQCRWYDEAYSVLRRLMIYFNGDDFFSLMVAVLDISILTAQRKWNHALYHIERIEERLKPLDKAPVVKNTDGNYENPGIKKKKQKRKLFDLPDGDFETGIRLTLQQKKTECLIRTCDLATAKREYKKYLNLANSAQYSKCSPGLKEAIRLNPAQSHLKTFLEFLSGNPDKALSLVTNLAYKENPPLGLCTMTNPDNFQFFVNSGDNLGIILNNNAGCCYLARRQFEVAGWYFRQANFECDNEDYKDKKSLPIHCLSYNLKYEVMYNYGVSRLLAKKPYDGFYYFWLVSREAFAFNPRVWLHLAECCVQINTQRKRDGLTSKESLLASLNEFRPTCPTTGNLLAFPADCKPPGPTLHYALKCIRKAMKLVDSDSIDRSIGLEVPPCDPVTSIQEIDDLSATILVTGLYIALIKKNFNLAINIYDQLYKLQNIHPIHLCLAKQYKAVALQALGQLQKCRQMFIEENARNYTFMRPVKPDDDEVPGPGTSRRGSNQSTVLDLHEEIVARDAFMYNQALADYKADDLISARRIVQVWMTNAQHQPRQLSPKFEKLLHRIQKRVESMEKQKQMEKVNEMRESKPDNRDHRGRNNRAYRGNEPPKNNRIQQLQKH